MTVVLRLVVIVAGFLAASIAAALTIAVGVFAPEWQEASVLADPGMAWGMVGFFGTMIAGVGLLPFLALAAIAEMLRLRSVLFYACAGGLGLLGLYEWLGFANHGPSALPVHREMEIMAGAGIAAGLVYWAIAGRRAGAWRGAADGSPGRRAP